MTSKSDESDEQRDNLSDADATLLEQLTQLGVDLAVPRIVEYVFVADSAADGEALCLRLQGLGHEFVEMPSQPSFAVGSENQGDEQAIWVESSELIAPREAAKKTLSLQLIASEFHSKYDGWSTAIDD